MQLFKTQTLLANTAFWGLKVYFKCFCPTISSLNCRMFSRITSSVEDTEKIICNHSFKLIISNGVRLFFVVEWAFSAKHLCFPPSCLKRKKKTFRKLRCSLKEELKCFPVKNCILPRKVYFYMFLVD